MPSGNIFGVRVDKVDMTQVLDLCLKWLGDKGKHSIFTPNIEFIMAAQKDSDFRKILNSSDLNIPDSARLGWAINLIHEKNLFTRFLKWPLFLIPGLFKSDLPVTTGADLFDNLINISNDNGSRIGLLGGMKGVAEKTSECLKKRYPKIKIVFIKDGFKADEYGEVTEGDFKIPELDILFVALGQIKQEMWISKNITKTPAKIFVGVGGVFDYVSGEVPRAPMFLRDLGLEWLYRLINQPKRIIRFGALFKFVFKVLAA